MGLQTLAILSSVYIRMYSNVFHFLVQASSLQAIFVLFGRTATLLQ